jgi:hypothetical protein
VLAYLFKRLNLISLHEQTEYRLFPIQHIIDTTECPIHRPLAEDVQYVYYSGKKRRHTLKYEIAISLHTNEIVWFAGGIGGSLFHDIRLARLHYVRNISSELLTLGDLAYVGDRHFLTPVKHEPRNQKETLWNSAMHTARLKIERVIARFKSFRCLAEKWRHNIHLHPIAFAVIAELVNIDMYFRPLQKNANK